ncbi:MAG: glutamate ligase domain-containing protein, partial [Flavisolibacter sp.]
KDAPIHFAQDRFEISKDQMNDESLELWVRDKKTGTVSPYELDLPGIYQEKNILTVLQSLCDLEDWKVSDENIREALKAVKTITGLQGRWERIRQHPDVILEVAHNREGIEQLLAHLQRKKYSRLHLIIGIVKDKDANMILELLPRDAQYYFTQAHIPRALNARELQQQASLHHLRGNVFDDVNLALHEALASASSTDLVLICGSIFLVAEVDREHM